MNSCRLLFIVAGLVLWGCGTEQDQPDGITEIQAVTIAGSNVSGMAFTAVSVDQSFQAGRFYYYDFVAGLVSELSDAESGDPWVGWSGTQAVIFNRQIGRQTVRVFDAENPTLADALSDAVDTPGLTPGDPWTASSVSSGELVIATPQAGGMALFDLISGTTSHNMDLDLSVDKLQIGAMVTQGTKVFAAHRDISTANTSQGNAQLFSFTVTGGTITAADSNANTAAIDGTALPMSSPTAVTNTSQTPLFVGLCATEWENCQANAASFSPTSTTLSTQTGTVPNLTYWNQIVDGPNANSVYAHVLDPADNNYKVVLWNTATGETSTVHTFSSERLFGITYDQGSRTLFVADIENLLGQLILYRDNAEIGRIELPTVPYHFAMIP